MSYKDVQKSYSALAGLIQNRAQNITEDTDLGEFSDQLTGDIETLLDEAIQLVMNVEDNE